MIVLFVGSAFRHGFNKSDYHAVVSGRALFLRSRRGHRNVFEILGRTNSGEYLHVVTRRYMRRNDKTVVVFHMGRMSDPDRKRFNRVMGIIR